MAVQTAIHLVAESALSAGGQGRISLALVALYAARLGVAIRARAQGSLFVTDTSISALDIPIVLLFARQTKGKLPGATYRIGPESFFHEETTKVHSLNSCWALEGKSGLCIADRSPSMST